MREPKFAAWVGLDWADKRHWVCLCPQGSDQMESYPLRQRPEAIRDWLGGLRKRFEGRPVAVVVEQSRGALLYALMECPLVTIIPVNPKSFANYRKALRVSGAKDDCSDAELLLRFGREHRRRLPEWRPETPGVRALRLLAEQRRKLVHQRTAVSNRLRQLLKEYFPQVLAWFPELSSRMLREFLTRWPTLEKARRAHRRSLEKFFRRHRRSAAKTQTTVAEIKRAVALTHDEAVLAVHPKLAGISLRQLQLLQEAIGQLEEEIRTWFQRQSDAFVFASFPGAGEALAPRLLAAFGTDRDRFDAVRMQCYSGIAPVTESSGDSCWVHHRWICPKFLKQTFYEFAECSLPQSAWAHAFYRYKRQGGFSHEKAVRALAFKWNRVLTRCWQDRTTYSEETYQQALRRRHSPVIAFLDTQTE
ncbi:MAG TPA: IS110 family transposase [Acidobacteriota bacterium]|nr:IS110 family transposase [Acidobacteriota bacterium]